MKKLTFFILLLFCSCQNYLTKSKKTVETNDREYYQDSLQYNKILNNSINLVNEKLNESEFTANDTLQDIVTQIKYGRLFDESTKHLIVTSIGHKYVNFTIFVLEDRTFNKLLSEEIWTYNFIGFYIQDINGDNKKDFIEVTMTSSGCCPREQYSVYLYQNNTGNFYDPISFMNPEFLPENKLIVGFEYGQPLDTYLYKFGWNGFKIDTLEYIKHNILDSTNRTFLRIFNPISINTDTVVINSIPVEYKNICDWFLSTE